MGHGVGTRNFSSYVIISKRGKGRHHGVRLCHRFTAEG